MKAVVVLSGGQDSATALAMCVRRHGAGNVAAITFAYGQRHALETKYARALAKRTGAHVVAVDNFCWNPFGLKPDEHEAFARRVLEGSGVELVRADAEEFLSGLAGGVLCKIVLHGRSALGANVVVIHEAFFLKVFANVRFQFIQVVGLGPSAVAVYAAAEMHTRLALGQGIRQSLERLGWSAQCLPSPIQRTRLLF